ncbi:MAG: sulfotransferase family 2 domain-containing protein [Paracoccus sp. (in: a-proteobacteria)]
MPFFKHSGKLIYFAHVPKCAGTSIENYLVTRYGPAAFLDRKLTPGNRHNWCRTSPQHLSVEQLNRLFPEGFFDAGFAFVRDPLARVRSAFHFHQTKRKKIPAEESFEQWLPRIAEFDKLAMPVSTTISARRAGSFRNGARSSAWKMVSTISFPGLMNGAETRIRSAWGVPWSESIRRWNCLRHLARLCVTIIQMIMRGSICRT